jgi:hypothetical protein
MGNDLGQYVTIQDGGSYTHMAEGTAQQYGRVGSCHILFKGLSGN